LSSHAEIHGSVSDPSGEVPIPDGIEIENLHGIEHAREVEQLQTEIWSASAAWVVPSHVLLIVSDYDGILLGARMDGRLVGFVLGFLARSERRYFHASHMLGVLPAYRQHGIGAALKRRQREVAREQGLDLMRWTFDPLEARNAYLNFHKLGAACHVYRPDYYGPMPDALNRDLPSDRLLVEWNLHATDRRSHGVAVPQVILRNRDGSPESHMDNLVTGSPIAIEVPGNVQAIKSNAPDIALSWRLAVRQAFTVSFSKGYQACDFRDGAYMLLPAEELRNEN
jgi:predicted GNAT superfamily acetyltransferase